MKPSPFLYSRPASVAEALPMLAEFGSEGKILAGGQSLVPLLSMRLAAPAHIVDINRIAELDRVDIDDGAVVVGALARHARVAGDERVYAAQPLISEALAHVAHATIRNRGTTVGSVAHADPAAEMPAVLCLLAGSVTLASVGGVRTVPAAEFFHGPLETACRPDEFVIEIRLPVLGKRAGTAFAEVSRRRGDYALCGTAALVTLDEYLRVASARVAYLSMSGTPVVLDVSPAVSGATYDDDLRGGGEFAREVLRPEPDLHATAEYRRQLAAVLTTRVLHAAAHRAATTPGAAA